MPIGFSGFGLLIETLFAIITDKSVAACSAVNLGFGSPIRATCFSVEISVERLPRVMLSTTTGFSA